MTRRTSVERYNNRMRKLYEDARRLERERLERGEMPNPNLTDPETARKYGWEISGREVKKITRRSGGHPVSELSAAEILKQATERSARRAAEHQPIDYARMQKQFPKQKAALTRAMHITDPQARRDAVVLTCKKTVQEWNEIGAWPDDWSHWQRALDDTLGWGHRVELGDL